MATLYFVQSIVAQTDIDWDGQQIGIETLIGALIIIGAIIGAIYLIAKPFKAGRETQKKFDRFFDDWHGEEARPADGIEARPGVLMRLHSLEERHAEVRDTLDKLDTKQDTMELKITAVGQKVDTVATKVQHELTPNHGTSTKDGVDMAVKLATAALTTVQDIQKKQEDQHKALVKWQAEYAADQAVTRQEWVAVFDGIRQMIPMDAEDQVPFWDRIAEAYATKTLIDQDDNTETA